MQTSLNRTVTSLAALLPLALPSGPLVAQTDEGPRLRIEGPPAPTAPAVISRDETGNATVRATRLSDPLRLDGVLDEPLYTEVASVSDFIQSLPDPGGEPTERTEAWISFDDTDVYVSARVWDSAPERDWVANEMRRDTNQLRQNDTFGVMFDTFYDRRNGVMFYTNPLGALAEFAITNEGNPNTDWNPIWDVRTGRFDGGWTVEMRIPFKSLRYRPGREQVWGLQLRRAIRRRNEWIHLTSLPLSAAGGGAQGVFRVSRAGTLVGIEAPPTSRLVEVKPYGIAGVTTNLASSPVVRDDFEADGGLDVKVGITENLTADFTYNTDFAQVEVDEQQVNLTRFSLFFPEKREFFLEGRGIFDFAPSPSGAGGGGGFGGGGIVPTMFFSRRIGLQRGTPVPILGGGRVTGKVGAFDVGLLDIQTDDLGSIGAQSTNFAVLRVRRDILARSSVGVLFENRSRSLVSTGSNQAYGVDGSFSFFEDLNFVGYLVTTRTDGLNGSDDSYRATASYDGDLVGATLGHLFVGEHFNPEIGFVRRAGFRQTQANARYSPRPAIDWIRQITFQGGVDYIENHPGGYVETREWSGSFQTEMENSDRFSVDFTETYENLADTFDITPGVAIPDGRYTFRDIQVGYNFGLQRPYSGNLSVRYGSFYGGTRTSVGFQRARIEVLPQLSLEPSLSFNWVDLEGLGDFTQHVAATRVSYSFSPRLFLSGLVQYSSLAESISANLRLRWEYAPGSEIFVVYTEERDTDVFDRFSELSNRALVIKVNRLLRL